MTGRPSILGRSAEIGTIERVLGRIEAGRGGCLAIVGEAGIGKTRLLDEMHDSVRSKDIDTVSTACLPFTTPLPLDPIAELLRKMAARGFEGITVPSRTQSGSAIFAEAADALAYAALSGSGLLLLLDDLQWTDSLTLGLIQYCTARFQDLPLAWLVATRPSHRLRAFLHFLDRSEAGERLELAGLTRAEISELIRQTMGAEIVGPSFRDSLYDRTGGNPFLCEELLRSIPPDTKITDERASAKVVKELVPPTIAESVIVQLEELPTTYA